MYYEDIIIFLKNNIKEPDFFKNKLFYTKDYQDLDEEILDDEIIITNAIPFDEYNQAHENTKQHIHKYQILPFLDTLGGHLICIGYGKKNNKLIYYYDSEFGVFELEGDDYHQFCKKLLPANYDWL